MSCRHPRCRSQRLPGLHAALLEGGWRFCRPRPSSPGPWHPVIQGVSRIPLIHTLIQQKGATPPVLTLKILNLNPLGSHVSRCGPEGPFGENLRGGTGERDQKDIQRCGLDLHSHCGSSNVNEGKGRSTLRNEVDFGPKLLTSRVSCVLTDPFCYCSRGFCEVPFAITSLRFNRAQRKRAHVTQSTFNQSVRQLSACRKSVKERPQFCASVNVVGFDAIAA